jgi:HAD superfamily phosphatase
LKGEGRWNNDWDASLELLRRHSLTDPPTARSSNSAALPSRADLIDVFSRFYFGSDPEGDHFAWDGFICDEPLLVDPNFFADLTNRDILWGCVSGAEPPSARFLLEQRLGLQNPPLIAMGDAPDKPDPEGLIRLASTLLGYSLGSDAPLIAYLGDTVADVNTVMRAREQVPQQRWMSLAVVPPHLQSPGQSVARAHYEKNLRAAGAEVIFSDTKAALNWDPNQI